MPIVVEGGLVIFVVVNLRVFVFFKEEVSRPSSYKGRRPRVEGAFTNKPKLNNRGRRGLFNYQRN